VAGAIGKHLLIKRELAALSQGGPGPLRGPVKRLSAALRQLDQLYLAIGAKSPSGPLQQALAQAERRASELAVTAGVPACAPLPTGHP
jgi:hypothetical protein